MNLQYDLHFKYKIIIIIRIHKKDALHTGYPAHGNRRGEERGRSEHRNDKKRGVRNGEQRKKSQARPN